MNYHITKVRVSWADNKLKTWDDRNIILDAVGVEILRKDIENIYTSLPYPAIYENTAKVDFDIKPMEL